MTGDLLEVSFNQKAWDSLKALEHIAPVVCAEETRTFLGRFAEEEGVAFLRNLLPVGVSGALRGGITQTVKGEGIDYMEARVFPGGRGKAYAYYQTFGRGPGGINVEAIKLWMRRKGMTSQRLTVVEKQRRQAYQRAVGKVYLTKTILAFKVENDVNPWPIINKIRKEGTKRFRGEDGVQGREWADTLENMKSKLDSEGAKLATTIAAKLAASMTGGGVG